jgi:hypothetical protein
MEEDQVPRRQHENQWVITPESFGPIRAGESVDELVAQFGNFKHHWTLVGADVFVWDLFVVTSIKNIVFDVEVRDLKTFVPVFMGIPLRGSTVSLQKKFEPKGIEFTRMPTGGYETCDYVRIWSPPGLKRIETVCVILGDKSLIGSDIFLTPSAERIVSRALRS